MYNVIVGGLINRGEYSTFSPIPTNITGVEVLSMQTCKVEGCQKEVRAKGIVRIIIKTTKEMVIH